MNSPELLVLIAYFRSTLPLLLLLPADWTFTTFINQSVLMKHFARTVFHANCVFVQLHKLQWTPQLVVLAKTILWLGGGPWNWKRNWVEVSKMCKQTRRGNCANSKSLLAEIIYIIPPVIVNKKNRKQAKRRRDAKIPSRELRSWTIGAARTRKFIRHPETGVLNFNLKLLFFPPSAREHAGWEKELSALSSANKWRRN